MQFPGIVVVSESVLGLFLAGTWCRIFRRNEVRGTWRERASLAALALPTIALGVELVLVAAARFHLLEALDAARPRGEWAVIGGRLWLLLLLSTGLLSLLGLIFAAVGKGSPRAVGALWSSLVLGTFLGNLVLAVSFH